MEDPAVAAIAALVGVLVFCAYLLAIDRMQRNAFGKQMGSRLADMPTPEVLPPQSSACSAQTSRLEQTVSMHGFHSSYQQQPPQQQHHHHHHHHHQVQQARSQDQEARAQEARARSGPAHAPPPDLDVIRPVEPDAIPQRGAPSLQPFAPVPKDTAYYC